MGRGIGQNAKLLHNVANVDRCTKTAASRELLSSPRLRKRSSLSASSVSPSASLQSVARCVRGDEGVDGRLNAACGTERKGKSLGQAVGMHVGDDEAAAGALGQVVGTCVAGGVGVDGAGGELIRLGIGASPAAATSHSSRPGSSHRLSNGKKRTTSSSPCCSANAQRKAMSRPAGCPSSDQLIGAKAA